MPIYEFHCPECDKDTEMLVRSTRWQGTACPHCGSKRLEKKLSVFASSMGGSDHAAPCGDGTCELNRGACGSCCGGRHRH